MTESLRDDVAEGRTGLPAIGDVRARPVAGLPFVVVDGECNEIKPICVFLADLSLSDMSPDSSLLRL